VFEEWIDNAREQRTYQVICPVNREKFGQLEGIFHQCGLCVRSHQQIKRGDEMTCTWEVSGSPRNHDRLMEKLFADADVKEFQF